jgi:hypothetical protein
MKGLEQTGTLSQLEALAEVLGVKIRYEVLEPDDSFSAGGFCKVRGEPVIILNKRAQTGQKILALIKALRRFDLTRIYVRPALRDLLENSEEKNTPPFWK